MMDKTNNIKRKIYGRDEMLKFYVCPKDVPMYLKDFPHLHNNYELENWCKTPLPKFKSEKHKNNIPPRLRTSSNTGETRDEQHTERQIPINEKYRPPHRSFNRRLSQNMGDDKERNMLDPADFNDENDWKKVERINKHNTANRPYSHNLYNTENNWKKWTVTEQQQHHQMSKQNYKSNKPISLQKNTAWNRKDTFRPRQQSVPDPNEYVEEMWQDDFESELSKGLVNCHDELDLDAFQLPDSTMPVTPTATRDILSQPNPPTSEEYKFALLEQSKNMWYYKDLSDHEQGPYHSNSMANWFATGFFNYASFVRRQCDERYFLLAEYRAMYNRIPFTEGSTIPQILAHTKIDSIEPKDLIAGVDEALKPLILSQSAICMTNCPTTKSIIPSSVICNVSPITSSSQNSGQFEKDEREKEEERLRQLAERERLLEEKEMEIKRKEEKMRLELEKKELEDRERVLREKEEVIRQKEEMKKMMEKFEQLTKQVTLDKSEPTVHINEVKQSMENSSKEKNQSSVKLPGHSVVRNDKSKPPQEMTNTDAVNVIEKPTSVTEFPELPSQPAQKPNQWNIGNLLKSNQTPKVTINMSAPPVVPAKSLSEIQAEEEKAQQLEQQKQLEQRKLMEKQQQNNKVTSFKDSILKSTKTVTSPTNTQKISVPVGKTIWDMASSDDDDDDNETDFPPISDLVNKSKASNIVPSSTTQQSHTSKPVPPKPTNTNNQTKPSPEPNNTKPQSSTKLSSDQNNNNSSRSISTSSHGKSDTATTSSLPTDTESLMDWCCVKLAKYGNKNRDISVISSMIITLDDQEMEEFAVEFLGDTEPIRSFCQEFISVRNSQREKSVTETPWMTVKKPTTPSQNNKPSKNNPANMSKGGKKKKKQSNKRSL